MAFPVNENIAQDVENTLRRVQQKAGYNFDLIVERSPRKTNPRDSLALVLQGDPEKLDGLTSSVAGGEDGVTYWNMPFEVALFVVDSEKVETPTDQRVNMIRADVEKAIMEDPTRGGLAEDTVIEAPQHFSTANTAHRGIIVNFHCKFGTAGNDPYQSRA